MLKRYKGAMFKLILLSVFFLFCLNLSQAQTSSPSQPALNAPSAASSQLNATVPAATPATPANSAIGNTLAPTRALPGKYEEYQSICRRNEYDHIYYLEDDIKNKRVKLLQDKIASGKDINRMQVRLVKEYVDQRKEKLANETYAEAKKLKLSESENNLIDGYLAFMQRKLKKAEVFIEKVVTLEPTNIEASKFLAEIFKEQSNYYEAAQIYEDLNKQIGGGFYEELCGVLITDSHHADGEKICKKAAVEKPTSPYPTIFLGISNREKNDLKAAAEYFSKSLKVKPTEMGYTCLAEVNFMEKKFDSSIENFKKSLDVFSKSSRAMIGLAWTELQNKNIDAALQDFKKICQTDRKLVSEMRKAYKLLTTQNSLDAKKFADEIQLCIQ